MKELPERGGGVIDVRVVRPEEEVVLSNEVDQVLEVGLAGLDAHEALSLKVLRRLEPYVLLYFPAELLALFVEAKQPIRDPAAARFEKGHAQPRVALEHAALDQGEEGHHLL